jgi:hypothetical protein
VEVLIVGEETGPHAVAAALEADDVGVRRPPEAALPGADRDEVGQLADALLAFDRLLGEQAPDAVLLVSESNLALAALLVATKARIPVVGLGEPPREGSDQSTNSRLIAHLADAMVVADAAAIVASVRRLVAA